MTLKIGIVAQNHESDKFGVNQDYLGFIYDFGNPVIICPINKEEFLDTYNIDALVLPGGSDVDYKRYTKFPGIYNYSPNTFLEHFDLEILPLLIGNIPIFGICRGLQTLNVCFGGTLRNLWGHPYSNFNTDLVHKIETVDDHKPMEINSFHHQGIDKLAGNFTIEAKFPSLSKSYGVIEAISDYSKKIFAVQWHPERFVDNYSKKKFNEILK